MRIDSTLWATPPKLVNLLDFKPEKVSIKTKSNTNNDIKVHQVIYENGGFYLTIDNLEGYFDFSNNLGTLSMLFANNDQQNNYYQIWKEILKFLNRELKLHKEILLFDNDLPIGYVFTIRSTAIAIRLLIEIDGKFYLEISLNHCLYEIK